VPRNLPSGTAEYQKEWRRENPERMRSYIGRQRERKREWGIEKYGLTLADYDAMLAAQQGVCAICEEPPGKERLVIDHCHRSERVRGLLCHRCNRLLGHAGDDPATLRVAANYLEAAAMTTETQAPAEDAIFFLPRNTIHPDPDQPRLHPDDELLASIDSEGIIQPITVRPHPDLADEWMIVDGERRWIGGARLDVIPCRIRLDLEEPVDRLIVQLAANKTRPLSALEEARAYKKLLDDDSELSQAQLAKRLGIPRTTIGDRIRLMELHHVWLSLIENGQLQPSHAPVLHRLAGVPAQYQVEAAIKAKASYWWGENMKVDDFEYQIEDVFRPYVHPLTPMRCEFSPKLYEGPTVSLREGMRGSKTVAFAADPEIWKPLVNAARAEKSKKTREMRKSGAEAIVHRGKKVKIDVPEGTPIRKVRGYGHKEPGHIQLTGWQGKWEISNSSRYDPSVLLDRLDRSKLVVTHNDSGETEIWTTDNNAFSVAVAKWAERWIARREELRQELAALFGSMPITTPHGDASRKIVGNLLTGRGRDGLADLKDMAVIAGVALPKRLSDGWTEDEVELADAWTAKLTGPQATDCLRVLVAMYYLAPEGPTQRAEQEELHERNRLASHVALFFPELLAKQIEQAKAQGKDVTNDDLDDDEQDLEDDLATDEELEAVGA
jgi:ParB/RepB/Spo0J family partition protein